MEIECNNVDHNKSDHLYHSKLYTLIFCMILWLHRHTMILKPAYIGVYAFK